MVVLNESELKTGRVPIGAIVYLGEKPTGVAVLLRRYDLDRWDSGLFHQHHAPPCFRPIGRALPFCQNALRRTKSNRHCAWSECVDEKRRDLVAALDKDRHFLDLPDRLCYCFSERNKWCL